MIYTIICYVVYIKCLVCVAPYMVTQRQSFSINMHSMSGVEPAGRHTKKEEGEEEEDPFYTLLDRSGCAKFHYKLQDCFHDNGGDWRKCQSEMKMFQECMNKQKQTS